MSVDLDFPGMAKLEGGRFTMGSDRHYPEEAPAHGVTVDPFWIDTRPVTNWQFAEFVNASGYRTLAETPPDPADYPGIQPRMIKPGSLVFTPPSGRVSLANPLGWWRFVFGADWRHPAGPDTGIDGLEEHPVVHIAYQDATAYADWAGKSLPTEAEWEFAGRGGLEGADYAWGEELQPGPVPLANYWRGEFPWQRPTEDRFSTTSPVCSYPPNNFGLFDMIGNVWEWTCDWFEPRAPGTRTESCCLRHNPKGGEKSRSYDPCMPEIEIGRRVLKGGSHLCAPNYCQRYRPAARYPQPIDTSTSHVGFRCIVRDVSR